MLKKSKYNIIFDLENGESKMIANSLYGAADVLNSSEYGQYQTDDFSDPMWRERGYAVVPEEEQQAFQTQYMDFIDSRDTEEIQLFFVPTYNCNFGCDYCYQSEYTSSASVYEPAVVDAFFDYIGSEFAGRKKYCTLFGGEPLLPNEKAVQLVSYFLSKAKAHGLETAIVTNGFHLKKYLPVLKESLIREVQVTLDGTREVHNKRRPLKGGGNTFDEIVEGVDALLNAGLSVNLRMVVDSDNIGSLADLAAFAIDKGWTKAPGFKTQLGRNYELHSCQKNGQALYSRVQMYEELKDLIEKHPHILEFHTPSFHFVKSLRDNGELPAALFDSCPGCKTEWAFDYQGNIYSCTATVGKQDEVLGTFFPHVTKHDDDIEGWQDRDILAIEKCRDCNLALVCGGGCGSVAKNQNGSVSTPDCRPVKEVAQTGARLFFTPDGELRRLK
ncbi:MAG: radical SAM protein [Deltaproteobacteria bacterium]|nr:radical SAM protein [Deltaproteobacteria bacterium]